MTFNNKNKRSKLWILILAGGLIMKILGLFWRKNGLQKGSVIKNLRRFINDEKKEYSSFKHKEETFEEYCEDSVNIFSYYFIPGKCNGHKPKILRTESLALILLVLFVLKISVTGYLFFIYPNQARMEEQIINDVLRLTNDDRLTGNLQPLAMNASLSFAAQAKAEDMLANNYFAHYGPDGKKPWEWIDRGSYAYLFVGENLAMNFSSAVSAHTALMNSPSHRKNIMNDKYRDVGLAIVSGEIEGRKTNILVELFASRQPSNIAIAPEPDHTAGTSQEKLAVTNDDTKVLATTIKPAPAPVVAPKQTAPVAVKPKAESKPAVPTATTTDQASTTKTINVDQFEKIAQAEQPATTTAAATAPAPAQTVAQTADLPVNQELNEELAFYSTAEEVKLSAPEKIIKWSKYIYFTFALLLLAALMINIFVKIKVQHKPVIFQTVLTILLIIGLMSIKVHTLETIARVIAVI